MTSRTTLVVPCYNEALRLDASAFADFFATVSDVNILLVNDGSLDRTVDLLHAIAAKSAGRAEVLDLQVNAGKAEAVRCGMLKAMEKRPNYVGFWDADLATPLADAPRFVELIDSRADIEWVFGARVKLLGRHIERRSIRHYLGRVFATAVSFSLGVGVYDTQCGAKLFRATPEFEIVLRERFLTRWIFDVEMMARLARLRRQSGQPSLEDVIYEYPLLRWRDVAGSKVKSTDFIKAIVELVVIRLRYA